MSYADIQIVAIVFILISTYGIFMFMYAAQPTADMELPLTTNFSNPDIVDLFGDLFDGIVEMVRLNLDHPEIFFINSILYYTLGGLIILVVARLVRGQG